MEVLQQLCRRDGERGREVLLIGGGVETHLIYRRGIELRHFAAWDAIFTAEGRAALKEWTALMLQAAREGSEGGPLGQLLHAPLWRASRPWVEAVLFNDDKELPRAVCERVGCALDALLAGNGEERNAEVGDVADKESAILWCVREINRGLLRLVRRILTTVEGDERRERTVLITAECGPRDDGYIAESPATAEEFQLFHCEQLRAVKEHCELAIGYTLTSLPEMKGWAAAAASVGVPYLLSPTVEPDGTLPDGVHLGEAISETVAFLQSSAAALPLGFVVNCVHPTHITPHLQEESAMKWKHWLCGARVNSSALTHAELEALEVLDDGDPSQLSSLVRALHDQHNLRLLGGCCGTDERHLKAIAAALY